MPILPVDPERPDALTQFRLAQLRPDFVFGHDLNNDVWQAAVKKACQPRVYTPLTQNIADDIRKEDRLGLIHSDRAIIAMFEARAKPSSLIRPVNAVSIDPSSEWSPFCAAMFGIHHPDLNEKYRDRQVILKTENAVDLVNAHKEFVDDLKQSWLEAGSYGLSLHPSMFTTVPPTIVLVKDVLQDLSLLWNLRAASDHSVPSWLIPIPVSQINTVDVQVALRNWLLAFVKYGQDPNFCQLTSESVSEESGKEVGKALQDVFEESTIKYVDYDPPKKRLRQVVAYEYSTTWPAELKGRRLTISPPTPKVFSVSGHSTGWFIDLLKDNKTGRAIRDMQLPDSTVIPELLNGPCPPSFEHSAVPRFGDGLDSINCRCTSSKETIIFHIPSSAEVLEELLREQNYEIVPDEKRSNYFPTIRRFGGLLQTATAFSGQSGQVIEILRSGRSAERQAATIDDAKHQALLTAQGHVLLPNRIASIGKFGAGHLSDSHFFDRIAEMLKHESERVQRIGMKRYRNYARHQIPAEMELNALLEHWAGKSVLRRRWYVGPCLRCNRSSFVAKINLKKTLHCSHCGYRIPMKSSTRIGYTLNRSVRHSLNQGIVPVVLTGRFLRNMADNGFFWLPGVKYKKAGISGDIDLLACCDGNLVFAECKSLRNTPHDAATWTRACDQFLGLALVAAECSGALVVLAAQVDQFPPEVQTRINAELTGRIPYLLLDKADLEKGRRGRDVGKNWPSIGFSDLIPSKFPDARIARNGKRQIKFGWAVYTEESPQQPDAPSK